MCEWLALRDCNLDFSLPLNNTNYGLRIHSTVKSLSLIDSHICGMETFFEKVLQYQKLEQFIFIFNKDLEECCFMQPTSPYETLISADLRKFKSLQYFEFSTYNDIDSPMLTLDEV